MDSERAPPNERGGERGEEGPSCRGLFRPLGPRLPVDICRFDIIRREDVHMSTVWPFLIKTVKLSPKTAVDSNRAGVHTALGPQRGFNFGLLADP